MSEYAVSGIPRHGGKSRALVAFWDGSSPGSRHMIETAAAKGLQVEVVNYDPGKADPARTAKQGHPNGANKTVHPGACKLA